MPALREIYAYNPWLFDMALKRHLHLPDTDIQWSADMFGPVEPLADKGAAETS